MATAFIRVFGVETPEDVVKHLKEVMEGRLLHDIGHVTFTTDLDPAQAPREIDPEGAVCRIEAWPRSLSSAVGRHAAHCHIKRRAANGSDGPEWISARGPARWP